jgi:hypothetical protein
MKEVCHTDEECAAMYAAIPEDKRKAAASKLLELLSQEPGTVERIRELMPHYPGHHEWLWHLHDDEIEKLSDADRRRGYAAMYNPHFGFGMAVRNALRKAGFGEEYFGIHNLDDIYIDVIEEAVR